MLNIEKLYEHYTQERPLNLSIEQFTLFAEFFPAVLIILSDGFFDQKEKVYLQKLVKCLGDSFIQDGFGAKRVQELQSIFAQEFEYLIQNIDKWKELYIRALQNHLTNFPENKETILDTLNLFAETSQDFNESEENMVKYLVRELHLIEGELSRISP
ncbi:MAG: hypothetical protein MUE85_17995 [Microscillaceae bacterium]|jgi:hypothetical protein|nr:hypothetical protein [Microscillaceae bacterium]